MMSLTLKEILLYNNQRIKMLLQNNIQLLEILSNIKQKDKEYKLYSLIKFQYNKKKYSFNFVHIIEKNKDSLEIYLDKFINKFDSKFI
jgi:hypothetical protein